MLPNFKSNEISKREARKLYGGQCSCDEIYREMGRAASEDDYNYWLTQALEQVCYGPGYGYENYIPGLHSIGLDYFNNP